MPKSLHSDRAGCPVARRAMPAARGPRALAVRVRKNLLACRWSRGPGLCFREFLLRHVGVSGGRDIDCLAASGYRAFEIIGIACRSPGESDRNGQLVFLALAGAREPITVDPQWQRKAI